MDEILRVGDLPVPQKPFDLLRSLRHPGMTILFLSRNMQEILQHCNRPIQLKIGLAVTDVDSLEVTKLCRTSFGPMEVVGAV